METFNNVFQPLTDEVLWKDYFTKGKWHNEIFKNSNPIVLELGCGKGEYTINLAEKFKNKNFIGLDIKGARMWLGARYANQNNLNNVAFLRTRIEFINSCFAENEIDEIWITFPDPQLKENRTRKRLTSSGFLNKYNKLIKPNGIIHLKTDSLELHEYTLSVLEFNNIKPQIATADLYNSEFINEDLEIKTFYENQFLSIGKPITYLKFSLENITINEPPAED